MRKTSEKTPVKLDCSRLLGFDQSGGLKLSAKVGVKTWQFAN